MKTGNIDINQLKRTRASSVEARMDWLYAALCFAKAPKKVVLKKASKK